MMKRLIALICCATALAWSGCSDDKADTVNPENLIGRWTCYKDYDGEYGEWDDEYGEGIDLYALEFRADGTGAVLDGLRYDDPWEEFRYTVEGNVLTCYYAVAQDYAYGGRIDALSAGELVIAYDYQGVDGKSCTDLEYFRRMD